MQQAYQALRVIYEAQTVHIVLPTHPGELAWQELCSACALLHTDSDSGIKAVILDFDDETGTRVSETGQGNNVSLMTPVLMAVRAIPQPVLMVVRATLSAQASQLLAIADFTLVVREARLSFSVGRVDDGQDQAAPREPRKLVDAGQTLLSGFTARRRGYITWAVSSGEMNREMEHILDRLRTKSALALRQAKASVYLGQSIQLERQHDAEVPGLSDVLNSSSKEDKNTVQQSVNMSGEAAGRLAALRRVNRFYLEHVIVTEDAREGLQAFQEKRQPHWKNR